jgi:signal transduction histidine kinase/ActR/RegA family two-component response regulator
MTWRGREATTSLLAPGHVSAQLPMNDTSFHADQLAVLERIAVGAPLPTVLEGIVRLVERQGTGMRCSLLLLDRERQCLRHGAAPSLPREYIDAINGKRIGPCEGSCGAAAYRGERVVVDDIATHPYWHNYRHLALPHGLRSCWSVPIFSPEREVLGAFAMYYGELRSATPEEIAWVEAATHLASIAIVRDRSEAALRRSEERARELLRLYDFSSSVGEALVRRRDAAEIYDIACRIAVEKGFARLAWVGIYKDADDRLEPAARFGKDEGYTDVIRLKLRDDRMNRGPAGRAMKSGTFAVSNDIANDPDFYFKAEALTRDLRSCAFFPLIVEGETIGVFGLYAATPGFFQAEEVSVLSALAASVAFAVESSKRDRERRRLEEDLRHAQKMEVVGRLAGAVAHDFNNLLTIILSYASIVSNQLSTADPRRADVDEIRKAGERAEQLTRQLLTLSRKQVLQRRVIALGEIVASLERMLRRLLREDITLDVRAPANSGHVLADAGQIEQVVINLVVNARDAMPRGGRLTLEIAKIDVDEASAPEHGGIAAGRYVQLSVGDTGCGMDEATRARIFEPFFTTKEHGRGTGLGLATVRWIVAQASGTITVTTTPDVGTTFRIYLPRVDAVVHAEPEEPGSLELRGSETVLVAEDEAPVRAVIATVLRQAGYRVLEAENGTEAEQTSARHGGAIQLLVTDVVMPGMGGRELAERVSRLRGDLRVLYVSGYAEDAVVQHDVLERGIAFLPKPITPDALLRKVRAVLAGIAVPAVPAIPRR